MSPSWKTLYSIYLKSPEWEAKKIAAQMYFQGECWKCGSCESLVVHHTNYQRIGFEKPGVDLVLLCDICHKLQHNLLRRDWRIIDPYNIFNKEGNEESTEEAID